MRVVFLVRRVPPLIDGVGDYTWHLVRALREAGVDARILTSRQSSVLSSISPWVHPVMNLWNGKEAVKRIQALDFQPDWCSFQYVPQMYGPYGLCGETCKLPFLLKRDLGCKTSVTFHEMTLANAASFKNKFLDFFLRSQAKTLLRGSDVLITTCTSYSGILQALDSKERQAAVIPVGNNIPLAAFSEDKRQELIKKYGLAEAKCLGLFGRMAPYRKDALAVRLLARARQEGLNTKLLLIGARESSHPLFQEMMQLARALKVEDNVIVTGELAEQEVSYHLQLVDVFLFAQNDGISTKSSAVMTALAHDLPLVAFISSRGDFEHENIPCGAFADPGKEEHFVEAGLRLLKQSLKEDLKKNGNSRYFQQSFSWERIAEDYLRAFALSNVQAIRGS